jgi:DNA-directed RNA polymerase subunit M/transcription elongation factor TFIIS
MGSFRIPAVESDMCPKCGASNVGRKVSVWRVADERGPHHECTVCAHSWKTPEQAQFSAERI